MRVAVLVAALALAACATAAPEAPTNPFNPAEAEFARKPGSASVRGQMFLRRSDGVVVYGAGSDAMLIPRTQHTESAMLASFKGGKMRMELQMFGANLLGNDIKLDPGVMAYTKRAKADGQGNFAFDGVPAGRYYVLGRVTWCAPSRYGCDQQGGDLLESVNVGPGDKTVSTILNGV